LAEKDGLIRNLRVTNDGDFVTNIPSFSVFSLMTYTHVGVHLRLLKNGAHRFTYPKNGNVDAHDAPIKNVFGTLKPGMIAKHSTLEYDRQMKLNADLLSKITLDSLYQDEDLIGEYRNLNGDREEDGEEESGGFMNDLKKGITPSPLCMYMCAKY
jgi:hypothetical protein